MNSINELTLRQMLPVMAKSLVVFIKPAGRELYFEGKAGDIPELFLDCAIREISPRAYFEEDALSVNRYSSELGIWIDEIPDWEERIQ